MNKKRYIIKGFQSTGRKLPLIGLVTLWLMLDRFHLPQIGWGIFYTLAGILIIVWIYDCLKYDQIDVDVQKLLKKHYEETEQDKKEES